MAMISNPQIGRQLQALAEAHRWIEHVVIGDPFGVLALDDSGQAFWLQLEHASRLEELVEMAASVGLSGAEIQAIRDGQHQFDGEFHLAIGSDRPGLLPAMALGERMLATVSKVPETLGPGPERAYARFLRDQVSRELDDETPLVGAFSQA